MKIQSDSANGVAGVAGTDDDSKLGHAGDTLISLPTDSGAPVNGKFSPTFAINKKPDSLYFYCKWFSFGGDTINCQVFIYKDSTIIGRGVWAVWANQPSSDWTALKIPLKYTDTVTVPDSATIFFMTGIHIQHSQSYLIVDNLSFNNFITSVTDRNLRSPRTGSDIIKLFNHLSDISFNLPFNSCVSLKVFDLHGREVATLVNNEMMPAGTYTKRWNSSISSGVYLYRLRAGSSMATTTVLR
jgi:hypothetical protein